MDIAKIGALSSPPTAFCMCEIRWQFCKYFGGTFRNNCGGEMARTLLRGGRVLRQIFMSVNILLTIEQPSSDNSCVNCINLSRAPPPLLELSTKFCESLHDIQKMSLDT